MSRRLPPLPTVPVHELDYWSAIDAVHTAVNIYDGPATYLADRARFADAPADLAAAHWCWSEVTNGGFHQFFSNPTGVLAPESIRGFQLIGALDLARITLQAVQAFDQPYRRDRESRHVQLAALQGPGRERSEWDPFYQLDEAFYATPASFSDTATAFVRQNLHQFFAVPPPVSTPPNPLDEPWDAFDLSDEARAFLEDVEHEPVTLDDVAEVPSVDIPRAVHAELTELFEYLDIDVQDRPIMG